MPKNQNTVLIEIPKTMITHNIKALQSFSVAAKRLSFTQAGAELNVTPGAVSRMVAKLEDYLGHRLFYRSPQGLQLTEVGAHLFGEISGPLESISAIIERLRRPVQSNKVNLVCHPTFAARWLLPRWSQFYRQFPEIEVQITTTLTDVDFASDTSADLVIQLSPPRYDGDVGGRRPEDLNLRRDHLLDIDIIAVCAPKLLAADKVEFGSIAELEDSVLIHAQPLANEWRGWLKSYAEATASPEQRVLLQNIRVDRGPVFETLELAIQAAVEGVGVTLAFADFVAEDLRSSRLVSPLPFVRRSSRSFQLISPANRADITAVRNYREWLLAEAR